MYFNKNGSKAKLIGLHLHTKYHEAMMLPLTINGEHLTKSVNRKWMSDRPELGTTC
jgi:hypothetical protein